MCIGNIYHYDIDRYHYDIDIDLEIYHYDIDRYHYDIDRYHYYIDIHLEAGCMSTREGKSTEADKPGPN